jgi:ribosomal-protein-alanine N-acetyltransferase
MLQKLSTRRLQLLELSAGQLARYLEDPPGLELELGCTLSREVVSERVRRAIRMKLEKMKTADPARLAWYTYWLIVIPGEHFGAGLIGFKGFPDEKGEAEVGYGIDPSRQNRGYVTEACREMIAWAFRDPACRSVVARDTKKTNLASNRVLAKLGMHVYRESEDALYWCLDRPLDGPSGGSE